MADMYDIYLYTMVDPDRMVRIPDLPLDSCQTIADEFWEASQNNDVMIIPHGEEWWMAEAMPDIQDATQDTWQAAVDMFGKE